LNGKRFSPDGDRLAADAYLQNHRKHWWSSSASAEGNEKVLHALRQAREQTYLECQEKERLLMAKLASGNRVPTVHPEVSVSLHHMKASGNSCDGCGKLWQTKKLWAMRERDSHQSDTFGAELHFEQNHTFGFEQNYTFGAELHSKFKNEICKVQKYHNEWRE
jgi:outer membrane protein TolC